MVFGSGDRSARCGQEAPDRSAPKAENRTGRLAARQEPGPDAEASGVPPFRVQI